MHWHDAIRSRPLRGFASMVPSLYSSGMGKTGSVVRMRMKMSWGFGLCGLEARGDFPLDTAARQAAPEGKLAETQLGGVCKL